MGDEKEDDEKIPKKHEDISKSLQIQYASINTFISRRSHFP